MTRTLLGLHAIVVILAVVPASARPPLPVAPPRIIDFRKHECPYVGPVFFTPDGANLVVTGSKPRGEDFEPVLTLWDAATGRHLWTLRGEASGGRWFDFSHDGKLLATPLPGSGEVLIRDVASMKEVSRLKHPRVQSARFSPDGKMLQSHWAHYDRDTERITTGVRVWNLATGRVIFEPEWEKDEHCQWLEFTRDGRLMMTTNKPRLRTWNSSDGSDRSVKLEGERFGFYGIDASGTRLLRSGTGVIQSHDLTTGKVLQTFKGVGVGENSAWLRPDGSEVVTTTNDGRVVMFDAATGRQRHAFAVIGAIKEHPPTVSPGPDQRWLVVQRYSLGFNGVPLDSWVAVYSREGRQVREDRDTRSVTFDPAGRRVVIVTDPPVAPRDPPRTTVTIHDAAAWLAGGAKKD